MADINVKVVVDKSELQQLKKEVKQDYKINVKATADSVKGATKDVNALDSATKNATNSVSNLGSAFMAKVKWGLIQTTIREIANAFLTAVDNMKEVDTQLTNIAKVSNQSVESLKGLADTAYDTASKYGVSAGQYMEAVYEYTKAGYADTAADMAELSTKAMLVGDTTATMADKFMG